MTTTEVANKLVELCREGKIDDVHETLFADNAQSIEANEMMGPKVVTGLDAIKAKSIAFQSGIEEFHGATISDPIVAGNSFAITWALDANFKASANSKNPRVTFTAFNQPPDCGNEFNQPGKAANNPNGKANAKAKPNIPQNGPPMPPPAAA